MFCDIKDQVLHVEDLTTITHLGIDLIDLVTSLLVDYGCGVSIYDQYHMVHLGLLHLLCDLIDITFREVLSLLLYGELDG
jgi:hypothetical protein